MKNSGIIIISIIVCSFLFRTEDCRFSSYSTNVSVYDQSGSDNICKAGFIGHYHKINKAGKRRLRGIESFRISLIPKAFIIPVIPAFKRCFLFTTNYFYQEYYSHSRRGPPNSFS